MIIRVLKNDNNSVLIGNGAARLILLIIIAYKTDIAVLHAVTNFKEQVPSATDINHANIHHFHENTRYASDHPRRKARVEISDTKAFIVNYR